MLKKLYISATDAVERRHSGLSQGGRLNSRLLYHDHRDCGGATWCGAAIVAWVGEGEAWQPNKNYIKISKQSALTVSQQFKINQQLVIGKTGLALAGLCQ